MAAVPARIPLADARSLGRQARRTALVRVGLAAAVVGLAALCFLAARGSEARASSYFAEGATGVIVFDFSTSIDPGKYGRIARVLRTVSETSQPIGLVVYSDTAYEAVPPGTRGDVLRPLLRFFEAGGRRPLPSRFRSLGGPQALERFGQNPWQAVFRGGTVISSGLRVAREMLTRDRVRNGSVILVSDLDDAPSDAARLTAEAIRYRSEGLDLRVVPLGPSREDRDLFMRLLGPEAFIGHRELLANSALEERRTLVGSFPLALVLGGAGLLLLLAWNERMNGRLRWRPGEGS